MINDAVKMIYPNYTHAEFTFTTVYVSSLNLSLAHCFVTTISVSNALTPLSVPSIYHDTPQMIFQFEALVLTTQK